MHKRIRHGPDGVYEGLEGQVQSLFEGLAGLVASRADARTWPVVTSLAVSDPDWSSDPLP